MTALRRLWRRYGPTFRWNTFRLHGEPPNGRWQPLRVTQIVGGRSWSLAITRTGTRQQADTAALDGAAHSVWLHGKWRFLTMQMTTEEKEAFADAADRYGSSSPDGSPVDRWWR